MRHEIGAAGGNEVFFLGRIDADRIVVEVEPLARGNRDAVAAIMIAASFGDVVIHNHPSGDLTPSSADIEIAGALGNQGVGFYIIDNDADRCYQAVAPFAPVTTEALSYQEIDRWFSPEGVLAERLIGYEHRDEQTRMAFAVADAFNGDKVALIEAGTGTGKSLAYLLPAVLWATRNRERVVISTNTINLQEQLIKKDIPFLQEQAGLSFRAVLVKGRSNYLCRRKLAAVKSEPALFADEGDELPAIIAWSNTTADGCRSDLSFIPKDELWEEVCCEPDQCTRIRCGHYSRCFFYSARRSAAGADILVVNHALLMADVAVRQETGYDSTAILPPFSRLILDEAHHLEDVSTAYLSYQISRQGLLKLLGRLQHQRKAQYGLLPFLSLQLSRTIPEDMDDLYRDLAGLLEEVLLPRRLDLVQTSNRCLDLIGTELLRHLAVPAARSTLLKVRVTPAITRTALWNIVGEQVRLLAGDIARYTASMKDFVKACARLPDSVFDRLSGSLVDLKGLAGRLEGCAEQLLNFIRDDDGMCRWFEAGQSQRGFVIRLSSAPLEVGDTLVQAVYRRFRSVILTSATLAVGDRFDFLKQRTGISQLAVDRVSELLLASPFAYSCQAFVGTPTDIPEPTSRGYENSLKQFLLSALSVSQGRAFVLFTSHDLLLRVYRDLEGPLSDSGLLPLRQGDMSRHMLLTRFRTGNKPVLFGTDSFWEGVDVQGDALGLVIITRLPFRVPTDPIIEARVERIQSHGGDPFIEYTIPKAVLKFKQGFGRLIRSRTDRGAVLVLDSRIVSRSYGKYFLDALPRTQTARGQSEEIHAAMKVFYATFPPIIS